MIPQTIADRNALDAARKALGLIEAHVQKGPFGTVEGIDSIDLGFEAMASALARLFTFPKVEPDERPAIEDVLAYLASEGKVDEEAIRQATEVRRGIRDATYKGLADHEITQIEDLRTKLYTHIKKLLDSATEAPGGV